MNDTGYIRIGYFEDFKGEDSILISVDINGLLELEKVFVELSQDLEEFDFSKLNLLDRKFRLPIKACRSDKDWGLIKEENGKYIWKLTPSKWNQFREMLTTMYKNSVGGHHYFGIDTEDLEVVISWNEYSEDFWKEHFGAKI